MSLVALKVLGRSGNKMATAIGVLTYSQSTNLGDATQSLAALYCWWEALGRPERSFWDALEVAVAHARLGEHVIVWVDRDRMSETVLPPGVTRVAVICNGWWMHPAQGRPQGGMDFPLPPWASPVFVSVHINNKAMLTREALRYLHARAPIGCRDVHTSAVLDAMGIRAYVSGCLTTCLDLDVLAAGAAAAGALEALDCAYAGKTVSVDGNPAAPADVRLTQLLDHNMGAPAVLLEAARSLLQLRNATSVLTTRLHVWLPLKFNDCNVHMLNPDTGYKPMELGAHDFAYRNANRFGGLLEVAHAPGPQRHAWRAELLRQTAARALAALTAPAPAAPLP